MKKIIIALTLIASYSLHASHNMENKIQEAYVLSFFGMEDIFSEQNKNYANWLQVTGQAYHYINDNSKNFLGIKDKKLTDAATNLSRINDNLITTIGSTYQHIKDKAATKSADNEFKQILQNIATMKKTIDAIKVDKRKANAKSVLQKLVWALEEITKDALRSIKKYL